MMLQMRQQYGFCLRHCRRRNQLPITQIRHNLTKNPRTPLRGAANGAMPSWKTLSDTDLAAVVTYTKNAWSNRTGQLVQPAEVVAQRAR